MKSDWLTIPTTSNKSVSSLHSREIGTKQADSHFCPARHDIGGQREVRYISSSAINRVDSEAAKNYNIRALRKGGDQLFRKSSILAANIVSQRFAVFAQPIFFSRSRKCRLLHHLKN